MNKEKWKNSFKDLNAEDFVTQFNEIMKEHRQVNFIRERNEEDEKVYFLETRKEYYPLQLVSCHGSSQVDCSGG